METPKVRTESTGKKPAVHPESRKPAVQSKKDVVARLVLLVDATIVEHEKTTKKLCSVSKILKMLLQEPDTDFGPGDINMAEKMECDEEMSIEIDGVTYAIQDIVELYDSAAKCYPKKPVYGRLQKFCPKVAKMVLKSGKTTRRNYGNFRHPASNPEAKPEAA